VDSIVTPNLKDFPAKVLAPHGIQPISPGRCGQRRSPADGHVRTTAGPASRPGRQRGRTRTSTDRRRRLCAAGGRTSGDSVSPLDAMYPHPTSRAMTGSSRQPPAAIGTASPAHDGAPSRTSVDAVGRATWTHGHRRTNYG
jgi:hypothetical protein